MSSSRPKGYMDWTPKPDVAAIIDAAGEILNEYSQYGPMTVRQIFYRLVGNYGYPKDERAYKRLADYLVKARRAQMISFHRIRDDGGTTNGGGGGYASPDEFLGALADYSTSYHRNPMQDQPYNIEVWCEAEGMVPMLGQMLRPWGISATGSGGFSSVTVTHGFAQKVLGHDDRPTVMLHIGDFDPSGESIFESMCQDIGAFVIGRHGGKWNSETGETLELHGFEDPDHAPFFIPRRVALTADQVDEHDLPTAPPKASDSRSAKWEGETTQAEAMPPDLLERILVDAVTEWIDQDVYDEVQAQQDAELELIGDRVSDAIGEIRSQLEEESDDA